MKVFLDTSVVVPALVAQHVDHDRCFEVLERVQSGKDEGVIAAHGLAETYAILTKLPAPFRHSPAQALLSIQENLLQFFTTVALSGADYAATIKEAAANEVRGGAVYDALLLRCAEKEKVGRVYTINLKHFRALAKGELASLVAQP